MPDEIFYAFHSRQHAETFGGETVYLSEDGNEVVCTCVSKNPDAPNYEWEDRVPLGKVTKFLRKLEGSRGKHVLKSIDEPYRNLFVAGFADLSGSMKSS